MIIGIYHSRHDAASDAQRLRDLETIARARFNTIATPLNLVNAKAALDTAARLSVKLLVENNDPRGLLEMAAHCKGHPGLLGWQIMDDADGRSTPTACMALHNQVKAIDPAAMTYISAGSGGALPFVGCADLLGVQEYPVPYEPISRAYTALAPIAAKGAVVANLQAFDWQKNINGVEARPPTPAELRAMALLAMGAGCRGILWYAFTDATGWRLSDHLPLWRECSMISKALKSISNTLVGS